MEEDDAELTPGDLLERAFERSDVLARLRVHAAQERLAEVGQRAPGEAADEALRPGDPERGPVDGDGRPRALEHDDPRLLEDRSELADAVRVMVVVPEHGVDVQLE